MTNVRGQYPPEFKLRAVAMMTEQGLSVAEVARQLGVSGSRLHEWKKAVREKGAAAFPGSGHQTPLEDELRRLRADVKRLEMERDVLKKAAAFFATQMKGSSPGSRNAGPSTRWPSCVACWACRGPGTTPGGPARPATPPGSATTWRTRFVPSTTSHTRTPTAVRGWPRS
jgi:transposase